MTDSRPMPGSAAPVFIIGTERSGSNLLRLIFNAHSRIAIPHPPHVLRYFAPLEASYGDLSDDGRFGCLVDDILRLVRTHIQPWEHIPNRENIIHTAPERSVVGIKFALYGVVRELAGKARWGCKSTFVIDHVEAVRRLAPDARFIHLVRDPRDVAVSSLDSVFNPCHPFHVAGLWRDQQTRGLDLTRDLPLGSIQVLRYEDLVDSPEASVRAVCAFLGEAFEPDMLRFFETPEARRSASLSESWRNTGSPVLAGNHGRYRKRLRPEQIRIIEAVTGPIMQKFGYEADYPLPAPGLGVIGPLDAARFHLEEAAMRARVEWRSMRHDKNHWRRWRRDATVRAITWRALLRGGPR